MHAFHYSRSIFRKPDPPLCDPETEDGKLILEVLSKAICKKPVLVEEAEK